MDDNATLIRHRGMCFNRTKLKQGKQLIVTRKAQKWNGKEPLTTTDETPARPSTTTDETPARPQKKQSIGTPSASVQPQDAPGFFGLPRVQADSMPSATSDPVKRKLRLLNFLASGRSDAVPQEQGTIPLQRFLHPQKATTRWPSRMTMDLSN